MFYCSLGLATIVSHLTPTLGVISRILEFLLSFIFIETILNLLASRHLQKRERGEIYKGIQKEIYFIHFYFIKYLLFFQRWHMKIIEDFTVKEGREERIFLVVIQVIPQR